MRAAILCLVLVACGSNVSTKDACEKVAAAAGGGSCSKDEPKGLGAAATELQKLELNEPKGKGCNVLKFKDATAYGEAVKAYEGAAKLAGPHRYGSEKALIFVQCSSELSDDAGAKVKTAVAAL